MRGANDGTAPWCFVSSFATEEWEADPEVPGSEMHELMRADGVWAGLTRFSAMNEPARWTPQQREVVYVLEGEVRIEIASGPELVLRPGDMASFPAGLEMIWHITAPFKEFWVLA